jgi:capsular exopolysaccharide synthesis family protein
VPDHTPALPAVVPTAPQAPLAAHENALPARYDAAGEPIAEGVDWRRYLGAIRRYRWLILVLMALGTAGGVLVTRIRAPRYVAQATIWIQQNETPRPNQIRGPVGNDQLMPAAGSVHLVKSYVVLDDVIRDRRMYLYARPEDRPALEALRVRDQFQPGLYRVVVNTNGQTYRLEGPEALVLEQGTVGDSIGRTFGIAWAPSAAELPAGRELAFRLAPLRDAAQGLANNLTVGMDPSGSFLRLSLTGEDPATTATIVNAIAQRYVAVTTELKRSKLTELARLLDDQLAAAKENLQARENALAAFRAHTITLTPDPSAAAAPAGAQNANDYFRLKVEGDQLRRDREAIGRALAGDSAGIEGLAFIGAVQKSADLTQALQELTTKRAELRALRYRYTDDHPSVRKVVADIALLQQRTIPTLARTLASELQARERSLTPEIAAGGRELQQAPQRAVDEARLRRDADLAAGVYISVQQRQSEARLGEASSVADVRLLDAAVAPRVAANRTDPKFLIMGMLVGLALGCVGAVVADRFDPRLRYADQVTREMGLRILGMLPHVKNRDAGPGDAQVAQLIEAMRSVRLNLMHAYGSGTPRLVTVTSPGVGDGKSFVSLNLAIACAQAGQRTLLIDGDARRGALHRPLKVSRTPGLTDLLGGRAPLEAVLQPTSNAFLQFIGAGKRLRESPELLGSPAMLELFARVRPNFDVIVVDSPPLGAGVDPCLLGTLTGSMVLVLRSGATHRDVTRTHLAMVSQLPIRLLGVVLNDVGAAGMYAYYGYYYLASYGAGEESAEEVGVGASSSVAVVREWEPKA